MALDTERDRLIGSQYVARVRIVDDDPDESWVHLIQFGAEELRPSTWHTVKVSRAVLSEALEAGLLIPG